MAKRFRAPKTPAVPLAPLGVRLLARLIDGAILTALVLPLSLLVRSGDIDPLFCLWDKPNRQTLHDKAARTIVIADRARRHGDALAVLG
ncbi:hypothetical protein Afil01_35060 [Actinorhabdospora filicis]|uniref:RDD family protein n=1 Tax=Actinorhabdospora filicis TaxID=1785913 RepID=A0A9W6SMS5_9ACTN|nr:hypothetical protein [Actinorhabdospora filicis]GLZ78699.1 hypothetical protein Afil01_35060 [Actinorhabdospora filicis]